MKTYLTTKELAELAGISEQAIRKAFLAIMSGEATQWRGAQLVIEVTAGNRGRDGKNYQVAVESLPVELQEKFKVLNPVKAVLNTDLTVVAPSLSVFKTPKSPASAEVPARAYSRDEHWEPWLKATAKHRKIAEMRFDLLSRIDALIAGGMTKTDAIQVEILETQELVRAALKLMPQKEAEREVEQRTGRLVVGSEMTVYRCYGYVKGLGKHDWLPALLPGYKGCVGKFTIKIANAELNTMLGYNAEILQVFSDYYLDRDQRTYSYAYRLTTEYAEAKNLGEVPSIATLIRHLNKTFSKQVQDYRREGKEASSYKNAAPPQDRDVSMLHALEWINGDGWELSNKWIIFPGIGIYRAIIWFWQDIRSRKILAFSIDVSENSNMLRKAFRLVLLNYGLGVNGKAFKVTVDNTHAASAKSMTGQMPNRRRFKQKDNEPMGLYMRLGCEYHPTLPAHGQSKPIEAKFRSKGMLGETLGKNPRLAGARIKEKTTITVDMLAQIVQEEVDKINKRPSESDACQGRSPDEVFYESLSQNIVLKPVAADLNRLLQHVTTAKANKDNGEIILFKNKYWQEKLAPYAGQELVVEYDPSNLYSSIAVYTMGDELFICEAPCKSKDGFGDQSKAAEATRRVKRMQKLTRKISEEQQGLTALERSQQCLEPVEIPAYKPKVVEPVRVTHSVDGEIVTARVIPLKTPVVPAPDDSTDWAEALRRGNEKRRLANGG